MRNLILDSVAPAGPCRDDLVQNLRIDACLYAGQESLAVGRRICQGTEIIDEFCDAARSRRTYVENIFRNRSEDRCTHFENLFVSSDHDCQGGRSRAMRSPADRSVENRYAFL